MADATTATKVLARLAKCAESDMRREVARLNGKALPPVFGMETLCGEQPGGGFAKASERRDYWRMGSVKATFPLLSIAAAKLLCAHHLSVSRARVEHLWQALC